MFNIHLIKLKIKIFYESCFHFLTKHRDILHLYLIIFIIIFSIIFILYLTIGTVYAYDDGSLNNLISAKEIKIENKSFSFPENSKYEKKFVGGIIIGFGFSLVVLFTGGTVITAAVVFVIVTAVVTIATEDLL